MPTNKLPDKNSEGKCQRQSPCSSCPFSKAVKPGALGDSPVGTYIGQILGPFLLFCHQAEGYDGYWTDPEVEECAGAAIFRENVQAVFARQPGLLRLPASDKVFESLDEFARHHTGLPIEIHKETAFACLKAELLKIDNRFIERFLPEELTDE